MSQGVDLQIEDRNSIAIEADRLAFKLRQSASVRPLASSETILAPGPDRT